MKKVITVILGLVVVSFATNAMALNYYQQKFFYKCWKDSCYQLLLDADWANYMNCSWDCSAQAQNAVQGWCEDSDGGMSFKEFGIVTTDTSPVGKADWCLDWFGTTYVIEGGCSANQTYKRWYKNCSEYSAKHYCLEGVCEYVNNPPELWIAFNEEIVNEGELIEGHLWAYDDDDDDLVFSVENAPEGFIFDPNPDEPCLVFPPAPCATFSWTPGFDQAGEYEVTFLVSDGDDVDSFEVGFEVVELPVCEVQEIENGIIGPYPGCNVICDDWYMEEEGNCISSIIEFADPDFEYVVRKKINKLDENQFPYLTQNDVKNIEVLKLSHNPITDLGGIEHFLSLKELEMDEIGIVDIGPLSSLVTLTHLDIQENFISDLTPLSGLTSLNWLRAKDNFISDIAPLMELTSLELLQLQENQIFDLTPLAELSLLTSLQLQENQISNLNGLEGLTSLWQLILYENQISDLTPLVGLISLDNLWLEDNLVSDLTPLAELILLRGLTLMNNQVSDLTPLSGLPSLEGININNNQVSDLTPLAGLVTLKYLRFSNNQVTDLTPLAGLTSLLQLWLNNNQVSSLVGLESLTTLKTLSIENNQVSDVTPIAGLLWLTYLYLANNQLFVDVGTCSVLIKLKNTQIFGFDMTACN